MVVKPVQRIPRYELLLKQLLAVTDTDHSEYHDLVAAHKKVQEIAQRVNEHQRAFENMSYVYKLQNYIKHLPKHFHLPAPSRRFLKEGNIKATYPKQRDDIYYLFTDLMLWTNKLHKFKGYIAFSTAAAISVGASMDGDRIEIGEVKECGTEPLSIEVHYNVYSQKYAASRLLLCCNVIHTPLAMIAFVCDVCMNCRIPKGQHEMTVLKCNDVNERNEWLTCMQSALQAVLSVRHRAASVVKMA